MEIAQHLVPALAGLLSGAVGSLIAPWVLWGIETHRERLKARRDLLLAARDALADPIPAERFRNLPLYFRIKPFLSSATIEAIEGSYDEDGREEIVVVTGGSYGGINPYAHFVLSDLSRKEQEWKLL